MGFEPTTSYLQGKCSANSYVALIKLMLLVIRYVHVQISKSFTGTCITIVTGSITCVRVSKEKEGNYYVIV